MAGAASRTSWRGPGGAAAASGPRRGLGGPGGLDAAAPSARGPAPARVFLKGKRATTQKNPEFWPWTGSNPETQAQWKGIIQPKNAPIPEPEDPAADDLFPEGTLETLQDVAIALMRVGTAAMMLHHGQEKLLSAEMFNNFVMSKYFAFLPGPGLAWTYAAGAVQAVAPAALALGVASRPAAASLAGTTLAAMYYHLASTGLEGFPLSTMAEKVPVFHNYAFEGPFMYLAIFLFFATAGPGKFAVSTALGWDKDKSLAGLLKQ